MRRFQDSRIARLFGKFVKAGYVEWDGTKRIILDSPLGVPQGGIISPPLSNLVLHELDLYVAKIKEGYEKSNENIKPYITNPKYHALTSKIYRMRKKVSGMASPIDKKLSNRLAELASTRRSMKSIIPNPERVSIEYVRYADDGIIGVWGTKDVAVQLKKDIELKLTELKLTLSEEKTLITNARRQRAKFLGTYIKRIASNLGQNKVIKTKLGDRRRTPTGGLGMTAPIPEIVEKLRNKGFLVKDSAIWRPTSISSLLPLESTEIINRYNSIVRGILNYYSFVDNRPRLMKIHGILKTSLRKTLSRKLKLSGSEFMKGFGGKITITRKIKGKENKLTYYDPHLVRNPMNFLSVEDNGSPFAALYGKVSSKSGFQQSCALCGESKPIEMHHIKHVRQLNRKLSLFDRAVAKINRKQVPLCGVCHDKVHRGEYNGEPIKTSTKNRL